MIFCIRNLQLEYIVNQNGEILQPEDLLGTIWLDRYWNILYWLDHYIEVFHVNTDINKRLYKRIKKKIKALPQIERIDFE